MSLLASSLLGPISGLPGSSGMTSRSRGRNRWNRQPFPPFPQGARRSGTPPAQGGRPQRARNPWRMHAARGAACILTLDCAAPGSSRALSRPAHLRALRAGQGPAKQLSASGADSPGTARAPGPRDCASDRQLQGGCRGGRAPAASPPPETGSRRAGEEAEGGRRAEAGSRGRAAGGYARGGRRVRRESGGGAGRSHRVGRGQSRAWGRVWEDAERQGGRAVQRREPAARLQFSARP